MDARKTVFACFVASFAFLVLLYSIARAAPVGDLPTLKVTASPAMAFAPADINVLIIARPDSKNRYLAVSLGANDSAFAGSSQRSLDGENERGELANIKYRDAPSGTYYIIAVLYDREGKPIAKQEAKVRRLPR